MSKKHLLELIIVFLVAIFIAYFLFTQPVQAPHSATPTPENNDEFCVQVITSARHPETGEVKDFPTPCDVPEGWETAGPGCYFQEVQCIRAPCYPVLVCPEKDTADWQTYRNEKYGFEFKYPGDWSVVGNLESQNIAAEIPNSPDSLPLVSLLPYQTLTEYREFLSTGWPGLYTEKTTSFAGKTAQAFYDSGRLRNYVVPISGQRFLSINAVGPNLEEILKTFKFTK